MVANCTMFVRYYIWSKTHLTLWVGVNVSSFFGEFTKILQWIINYNDMKDFIYTCIMYIINMYIL